MARLKTKYQGITSTARYLTVHFELAYEGQAIRFCDVKIPMDDVSGEDWAAAMDTAARRRLMLAWADEGDAPMF